jgi:hypothetical protein
MVVLNIAYCAKNSWGLMMVKRRYQKKRWRVEEREDRKVAIYPTSLQVLTVGIVDKVR